MPLSRGRVTFRSTGAAVQGRTLEIHLICIPVMMMAWPLLSSSNWMFPRCKTLAMIPKRFCESRSKA